MFGFCGKIDNRGNREITLLLMNIKRARHWKVKPEIHSSYPPPT
jgi:hypothetical protein